MSSKVSPDDLVPVRGLENVSQEFKEKVIKIADDLGTDPNNLMAVMSFESGGTFSPSVKNAAGSGATGLIQFMPKTAEKLGTSTEALAKMTPEQQLDYVAKYFAPHKGKLETLEDTYMAVLYPKAIGKPDDFVLFVKDENNKDLKNDKTAYGQNKNLDSNQDEKITKAEAAQHVRKTLERGLARQGKDLPVKPTPSNQPQPQPPQPQPSKQPVLREGARGDSVRKLQEQLQRMGYNVGTDGVFGSKTKAAVEQFQKDHGLKADGIVGNNTLSTLSKTDNYASLPQIQRQAYTPKSQPSFKPLEQPRLQESLQKLRK